MNYDEAERNLEIIWSRLVMPGITASDYNGGLMGLGILAEGDDFKLLVSLRREDDQSTVVKAIRNLNLETLDPDQDIKIRTTGAYVALASFTAQPGIHVQRMTKLFKKPDGPVGALGAFVSDKKKDIFLLGAEHVFNNFGNGGGSGQIHHLGPGATRLGEVSTVLGPNYNPTSGVESEFDCALAALEPGVATNSVVRCFGASFESQPVDPVVDQTVLKCGPVKPFRTEGRISTIPPSSSAVVVFRPGGTEVKLSFKNQIDVRSSTTTIPFAQPGDSGATVVWKDGAKFHPTGLLIAQSVRRNSYLANPMTRVRAELGFEEFV